MSETCGSCCIQELVIAKLVHLKCALVELCKTEEYSIW